MFDIEAMVMHNIFLYTRPQTKIYGIDFWIQISSQSMGAVKIDMVQFLQSGISH